MFQVSDPRQSSQPRTADRLPVTVEVYRALEQELELLRAERRDLAIPEDQAITDARVVRLEDILARAEVVVDDAPDSDLVAIGSVVTVLDHASGRTDSYIVDGAHGSRDSNVISALSPMGVALIGHESGDVVSVELPRGGVRTMTVLDVAAAGGT